MQVYILGTKPVPGWCRNYIMPYRKLDGSVGYEFYGYSATFYLKAGDKLIKQDGRIHVEENND